jgi:hypothetical protein
MNMKKHYRSLPPRRRGMTSMLAMLFLILFSTMAVGFYAATSTQSQVAANDLRIARANMATESGMEFMRYQLGAVSIPPNTATDVVIDELFVDLQEQLNDTGNLGEHTVTRNGNTIYIPGGDGWVNLDAAGQARFRATITDWAGEIVVKVQGNAGGTVSSMARAITMDFSRIPRPTNAFDYAVASKGQVVVRKGAVTTTSGVDPSIASIMSSMVLDPAVKVSGGTIGGEINIIEGATAQVTGGNVAGTSSVATILTEHVNVVDAPEFPTIDTSVYAQYATNVWDNGKKVQQNIRVPAGSNPQFNGNDTIQGIMYIESPNTVTFRGDFKLHGFIVFENKNASDVNILDFRGNVTQAPLPAGPEFDALRATSGVAFLAPTASMMLSGASDSYIRGNVITAKFTFEGSGDLQVDQGTLMTYDENANSAVFNGKAVKFTATGALNMPTVGISYSSYYTPDAASYQEVTP